MMRLLTFIFILISCQSHPQNDGYFFNRPYALKSQKQSLHQLLELRNLPNVPIREEHSLSVLKRDYTKQALGILSRPDAGYFMLFWSAHFPKESNWRLDHYEYHKKWRFTFRYLPEGFNNDNWQQRFSIEAETYLENSDTFARLWVKSLQTLYNGRGTIQAFYEKSSPKETLLTLQSSLAKEGNKTSFLRFVKTPTGLTIFKYENKEAFLPPLVFHYWKGVIQKMKVEEKHLLELDAESLDLIKAYYRPPAP